MDTRKMVFYRFSAIGSDGKANYLHLFTGHTQEDDKILVEKSLLEIGKKGTYFPQPGEETVLSAHRMISVSEMMEVVVSGIFDGEFDLDSLQHIRGEL